MPIFYLCNLLFLFWHFVIITLSLRCHQVIQQKEQPDWDSVIENRVVVFCVLLFLKYSVSCRNNQHTLIDLYPDDRILKIQISPSSPSLLQLLVIAHNQATVAIDYNFQGLLLLLSHLVIQILAISILNLNWLLLLNIQYFL